jgi:hypothetical protein
MPSSPAPQHNNSKACRPTGPAATGPSTSQIYTMTVQAPAVLHQVKEQSADVCLTIAHSSQCIPRPIAHRKREPPPTHAQLRRPSSNSVSMHSWSVHTMQRRSKIAQHLYCRCPASFALLSHQARSRQRPKAAKRTLEARATAILPYSSCTGEVDQQAAVRHGSNSNNTQAQTTSPNLVHRAAASAAHVPHKNPSL